MILAKDFEDFIKLLNTFRVEYLVVGGYALALHGKPRHTGDLDIWINVTESNAEKLMQVIEAFGLGDLGLSKNDFLEEGMMTQIGYPPLRIDLLTQIDGLSFPAAYKNKLSVNLDGLQLDYIGLNDFIANKEASGRLQDLSDIAEIRKIRKSDR